jgi:hypothetical protein
MTGNFLLIINLFYVFRLHSLTFGRKCTNELIVKMKTARQGHTVLARYESFVLADESDGYKLTLGPLLTENPIFTRKFMRTLVIIEFCYIAIDGLLTARDRPFVTWDRQQHYCAINYGGWWLPPDSCGQTTLTSDLQAHRGHSGILWGTQRLGKLSIIFST